MSGVVMPEPAQVPAGKDAVLLVEDTEATRLVIRFMLEALGFDVHCACTGKQAVDMTLVHHYVAVLMDVEMPEMDGLEATKAIRYREGQYDLPPVRVVGITCHHSHSISILCRYAGMDDILPKPFFLHQLAEKLAVEAPETLSRLVKAPH